LIGVCSRLISLPFEEEENHKTLAATAMTLGNPDETETPRNLVIFSLIQMRKFEFELISHWQQHITFLTKDIKRKT
jgi:hypothetical protein